MIHENKNEINKILLEVACEVAAIGLIGVLIGVVTTQVIKTRSGRSQRESDSKSIILAAKSIYNPTNNSYIPSSNLTQRTPAMARYAEILNSQQASSQ